MRLSLASLLLFALLAAAAETPAREVRLDVKPLLCITDRQNPNCELSFLVLWQSTTSGYYCLFNDFENDPLRCWREARSGRTTDDRRIDETFRFWITGEDPANRLAEVEVEVLQMDSGDRRRRRRTRHVWDIN